jgi:hypothetical protein
MYYDLAVAVEAAWAGCGGCDSAVALDTTDGVAVA